jgi:signal transduction histidine kinase
MARRSLRSRITVWFTITVIATLACVLLVLHLRIKEETMSQVTRETESASDVFLSQHRARGDRLSVTARLLADLPKLGAAIAGTGADPATIEDLIQDLERVAECDALIVTDAEGVVVGDTRRPSATGESHRQDESVREALKGRRFTRTVVDRGDVFQFASAPIRIGAETLGSVHVGHRIDDTVARRLQQETGSEVSFFIGDRLTASSLSRAHLIELRSQLSGRQWLPTRSAGEKPPFALSLGGQQYLSLARPLHSGRGEITYLLQKSLSDALQPYRAIQQSLLGIGALGLICAMIVSYAVSGGIAEPLLRIVGAAEALGRGDWSQRVDSGAADEIGVLGQTFNTMATKLESWDSDLRRAVAERTSELDATVSRLDRAYEQMRRFNADASHELRTPLTIVRGETEVALRSPRSPGEYQAALRSILEESERMSHIVDSLLFLARADSGELRLETERVPLHEVLQNLHPAANVLAAQHGIAIEFDVGRPLFVAGDALRLHQLFLNLVDNAIKYTPAGGSVLVSSDQAEERAVVRVSDTGVGIEAEHLTHLFDRFFRVDKARGRAIGGTGLGLSICKWIVDAHRGEIRVMSTPCAGSVFEVTLPIEPDECRLATSDDRAYATDS